MFANQSFQRIMGKKTNATRDGERVVKGLTEDVRGGKVESGRLGGRCDGQQEARCNNG